MKRWWIAASVAVCMTAVMTATQAAYGAPKQHAQATPPPQGWTYDGPYGSLRWDKLNPAWRTCADGHQQSPVDIRKVRIQKNLPPVQFHYLSGPMKLVHDGHTVRVTPPAGSYLQVGNTRYDLVEFHFHHPGEEVIAGQLSDMSIHFVHRSADGKMAIVAVQLDEGNANTILAGLWEHLPKKLGASGETTVPLNPDGLLPANRAYWTYTGSLTEPPCTEGVQWYVLQQPITLSRWQLTAFAPMFPRNTRPAQPLHGRRIYTSQAAAGQTTP